MNGLVRHVKVWEAEGRCAKGHLHFAQSQQDAQAARAIVRRAIAMCAIDTEGAEK